MGKLKRKSEFKQPLFKPVQINDSRFGLRKFFLNQSERPSTFSYPDPNKNWWGTR